MRGHERREERREERQTFGARGSADRYQMREKLLSIGSYGVDVAPGQDAALILTIAVCIDQMAAG